LLWQAQARDIAGAADRSTYGLTADGGVLLLDVPAGSAAAKAGLTRDDVIIACNTVAVKTIDEVGSLADKAAGGKLDLTVIRKGKQTRVEVSDYTYGG